jgi:hypothetical protein
MPELPEILLARSRRAYLIAPAGYGKTEVIAKAVGQASNRQLVLTHTHAGVRALRDRFRKLGVPPKLYHLDTIAGWALTYVQAYPALSDLSVTVPPSDENWSEIYTAAANLMSHAAIKKVLKTSYDGLYVDEYQDCTQPQHKLTLSVAESLACRFVGDPLQGIFDFAGKIVDWNRDIPGDYERLPDLTIPWRWQTVDQQFATWLDSVRTAILNGRPIDLRTAQCARVKWVQKQQHAQRQTCMTKTNDTGNIVAIHTFPQHAHRLAKMLLGSYTSMEAIYSRNLLEWAEQLDTTTGVERAITLLKFAEDCITKGRSLLGPLRKSFEAGKTPKSKTRTEICYALCQIPSSTDPQLLIQALELIQKLPDVVIYRRELWKEMVKAIGEYAAGVHPSIFAAVWKVRSRTSLVGRKIEKRLVSWPPLIKGLEFDHSIVLDADALKAKELYVAMTRGVQSLTIISASPILQKPPPFSVTQE